jgi:hypothetical protein
MSKQELVAKGEFAVSLGAHVVITGSWVWADFPSKPDAEIRKQLIDEKFKWAAKKQKWYFAGKPRSGRKPMSWDYITNKYGQEELA